MSAPIFRRTCHVFLKPDLVFVLISCLSLFFLGSCGRTPRPQNLTKPTDSIALIKLPLPSPIKLDEINRIDLACNQWYDSILKPGHFNGSMLVAKGGNIVFEKCSGTGHIGGSDSITINTPTHIASISKTFTAMSVLKLVQEGKLQLDQELNKYFPGFNYPGVTIRSLLSHRSGLPNYLYFMDELGWDKSLFIHNQDVYDWLVIKKPLIKDITTPNTHFAYCNTNYALLALLIEKVTGISYPQYLKQTFFIPLQMSNSFVFTLADTAKINPSYDWRGEIIPLNFLDAVYGDKNIYTTPVDLLKWDQALNTNLIFFPETLQEAYAPYSNEKAGIRNYGLGWRMNIYPNGKKIIFHNGWWHGNNAVFIRLLDEHATIIVMGNKYSRGIYKAKYLINIFNPFFSNEADEEENGK